MIKVNNSALYMIGEVIPRILSILLLPIYTRYFSPDDYGIMSYIDSLIVFVFMFSILSLNSYVLRTYFEQKNLTEQKKLVGNIFVFIASYNIFTFFFFSFFLTVLLEILGSEINFLPLVFLALVANFFETFSIIPLVLLRINEKAGQFIFYSLSKTFLQIFLILAFVIILDYGIDGKYYAMILANFIFALIYIKMMLKESILNFYFQQIKSALKFSLPLAPGAISFVILDISDRVILEKYVTLEDLGLYSIAYTLGFGLNVVINGSYRAFEPILFKNFSHHNFLEIFIKIKDSFFALVFFAALFLILYSQEVLKIVATDSYFSASYIVPIIVLAAIAKGIYMLYAVLAMYGKNTKIIGLAIMFGAIVNLIINLVFIPKYGVLVAAISTVISFLLISFIIQVISYKYIKLPMFVYVKDYLLLTLFAILTYVLFYKMKIEYSTDVTILKTLIFILFSLFIKWYYNINFKGLLKNAN
jgi:O-antigen/teichoic acid export membrane protein